MRRIIGLTLVALGVFLVILAIALPSFVYPRIAKVPANPTERIVARGTGLTVLVPSVIVNGGNGILTNQTVTSSRYVVGQVPPNDCKLGSGEGYYRMAYNAFVDDNPTLPDNEGLLQATLEASAFNGKTGEASNSCPGYIVDDPTDEQGDPVEHQGLVFKFPFNTERKNYEFWDSSIRATATARFDSTTKIDGLQVYKFVQSISDEVVDQRDVPGALFGSDEGTVKADRLYSTVRSIWVEPRTGAIIKGGEEVDQRLTYNGRFAPVIKGSLMYTPETVDAAVKKYKPLAMGLAFVSDWGPIGGWVLGPILALIGITLLYLNRRTESSWDDEWNGDDDEDEDDDASTRRQSV